ASLILLDWFLTFGTRFCISHDPGDVFTFVRVLDPPRLSSLAITRPVRLSSAFEAKGIATLASHIFHAEILVLYAVIATLIGTPPYIFVVVSVSFTMPLHVSYK